MSSVVHRIRLNRTDGTVTLGIGTQNDTVSPILKLRCKGSIGVRRNMFNNYVLGGHQWREFDCGSLYRTHFRRACDTLPSVMI